jgi:hypothetical protein
MELKSEFEWDDAYYCTETGELYFFAEYIIL